MAEEKKVQPLLEIRNLKTYFYTEDGVVRAVDGVDIEVYPGEVLGIVGESGSGKSVTAFSIMGLLPPDALRRTQGSIMLNGRDLATCRYGEILAMRATTMSMVFQEPMTALNPVQRIGHQLDEVIQHIDS